MRLVNTAPRSFPESAAVFVPGAVGLKPTYADRGTNRAGHLSSPTASCLPSICLFRTVGGRPLISRPKLPAVPSGRLIFIDQPSRFCEFRA
jgi:hypothetical protein